MHVHVYMDYKPFHRPHRFFKEQIGISFYGNLKMQSEQTNERNEREWTLRKKKGKSNEIEMQTLWRNYIVTQECIAHA